MLKIILIWFRIMAAKAAKKVLSTDFKPAEIKLILEGYWRSYKVLQKEIEKEATFGGTLMVHLAAMSTAFFKELTHRGISETKITKYFYDIAWSIYKIMGQVSWNISGIKHFNKSKKLLYATQLFRWFPFNSPSFNWVLIPQADSAVCFNCTKCPVAEYFETKGLSEFCVQTWCAMDFTLAESWNAKLYRNNTIAGGAKICDFKWIPNEQK